MNAVTHSSPPAASAQVTAGPAPQRTPSREDIELAEQLVNHAKGIQTSVPDQSQADREVSPVDQVMVGRTQPETVPQASSAASSPREVLEVDSRTNETNTSASNGQVCRYAKVVCRVCAASILT